ncbi:DEAD-domain-containing protein [Saitoella complicata NRRL Y-17804]|uniref:DEAD-domain-containing protein n=1 Tax=Saitoella complicata (strain BCRC 22490 / CBS 7301 / JCM 7358 / NBRC 10748 / NRRL Y-17804) TaxID=698492 RepID=UPI000867A5F2|nr:DEAD-domain-containing protein [Saitoella complicata NRRL Y-17804]ODQ52217.1 DEAD-domain-containing protein [Saitoella complicata NRRL Y-17804]
MADDDGMLVNFDLGSGPARASNKGGSGRWTDRLKQKKQAQHRERREAGEGHNVAPPERVEEEVFVSRAPGAGMGTKRKRDDGEEGEDHPPAKATGASKQVISSLFTYNPESHIPAKPSTAPAVGPASNAPMHDSAFGPLKIDSRLCTHLENKMSITAPTSIQSNAIPYLLDQKDKHDVFIQAQTGSGKTLAFLLPIVHRLMQSRKDRSSRSSGVFALILGPTRELCQQIYSVLEVLLRCSGAYWLVPGLVIGGEKKKSEKARLRKGVNILVATPGRMLDHLENTKSLDVSSARWLVLDEGDRMMDSGFEETLNKILNIVNERSGASKGAWLEQGLPKRRVTVLCSATIKAGVEKLGQDALKDTVYVKADDHVDGKFASGANAAEFSAPAQLDQQYSIVPAKLRLVTLGAALKNMFVTKRAARTGDSAANKAIVFFSCADSVDYHFKLFTRSLDGKVETEDSDAESDNDEDEDEGEDDGEKKEKKVMKKKTSPADAAIAKAPVLNGTNPPILHRLHGSLPQHIRQQTLAAFTKNTAGAVLFCTDVASRGLDLPDITNVVQYDPPFAVDEYVHRIGRTARAGRKGEASLFLLPNEEGYLDVIKRGIGAEPRSVANEELLRKVFPGKRYDWELAATEWQLAVEKWVLASPTTLDLARNAYKSHVRAYATHVAAEKSVFNVRNLHLGHIAKAFGLREAPGGMQRKKARKEGKDEGENRTFFTGRPSRKKFPKNHTTFCSGKHKSGTDELAL